MQANKISKSKSNDVSSKSVWENVLQIVKYQLKTNILCASKKNVSDTTNQFSSFTWPTAHTHTDRHNEEFFFRRCKERTTNTIVVFILVYGFVRRIFFRKKKKTTNAHKRSERKKEEKIVEKGHLWQAMNAIENEYICISEKKRTKNRQRMIKIYADTF